MEMDLLNKEWITILKTTIAITLLLVVCKSLKRLLKGFGNWIICKPTNMEPTKCHPFLTSIVVLVMSIYKQKRSEYPLHYYISEAVLGCCCALFAKERIFCLYFFQKPLIVLFKPETVKAVLTSSTMIDKSEHYNLVHPWLGTGLFTSSGDKWRERRKLLAPTFHSSILEGFIPIFQEQSSILVSKLQALTGQPWVDIVPLATFCTLDIICQTIMGVKIHAQTNGNKEYVQAIHEISNAMQHRGFRPWLHPDFVYYKTAEGKKNRENIQCVQGLARKVIREKKTKILEMLNQADESAEIMTSRSVKRPAFLEFLLEYHFQDPSFTEEDIREEVDTFMFGGHDTTGMGISWILYCVGLYPDIQDKIAEELDEIFQDNSERKVNRKDLTNMSYLECCIKETFRLYPPGPFFMKECKETVEISGHTIHPGSFFFIYPYALHRDPESFPDPEKFNPERFFPENSRERHPYAYIPFSAGPRNCIGQKFGMMELKIMAANILRRFRVTSLDPRDKVVALTNMTLQNAKPLRLRFETRKRLV